MAKTLTTESGAAVAGEALYSGLPVAGATGTADPVVRPDGDDFAQPGALYRLMSEDERTRLVENIANSLAQVSRGDIVTRAIEQFRRADEQLGERIELAIKTHR